ncbi:MAG: HlyD family efflux transporter periplasmic adaptor subunit [Planctomycetes bacterium]|nr:HlyD family efflux transporter periplasmic adaptor subunit [Planctomycetota bacterium]
MRTGLILFLLIAALGGGVAWYARPGAEQTAAGAIPPESLYTVGRHDLFISLTEQGTLVAKDARKVVMKVRRGGKIVSLVEEGKLVTEGEELVTFDTTDLESRIEQLELEVVQYETNLRSAQTELEIQKAENIANVEKAATQLERSTKDLERYRQADGPLQRRKLQVEIKDAQTTHKRAKKRYQDSKRLLDQHYIKPVELEADQINFEKAEVVKEGAELALRMFDQYTHPMTIQEKESKLRDVIRDQSTTKKRASSRLLQREVAVAHGNKRFKRKTRSLKESKADLSNMKLLSPCPGIVIYGDPKGHRWFRNQVKVGGHIWGGNTIMTIPDLRLMQVRVAIHEADINKIVLGQKATVTMDTYSGLVLKGSVTKIAAIAGSPEGRREAEVKKFDVEITLEGDPGVELKPGISAKARIMIDTVMKAVAVPLQCVFLVESDHYCFIQTESGPRRRLVKVGQNNATMVEILSGLEEGDQVLLYNPNLAGGGAKDAEASKEEDAKAIN